MGLRNQARNKRKISFKICDSTTVTPFSLFSSTIPIIVNYGTECNSMTEGCYSLKSDEK